MSQNQFAAFNLDPALAEMVEVAQPAQWLEGILRVEDPARLPPAFVVVSRFKRIFTGRFRAADAWTIRQNQNVVSLKAARPLGLHDFDEAPPDWLPPPSDSRENPRPRFTGRGCIVAALDFGLDFGHPNFRNADGSTRVLAFWHQGAAYDPRHPNRFGYGRQFTRDEIDAALRADDPYKALGYHPAISDSGLGTHGTHTLDIAAGNGRAKGSTPSAAPDADLVFVHLSTPNLGVVGDLGDSVRLLEGLDYVNEVAGGRPWVVNLSVGRTAGSHDGTSPVEQGMHELLRLGPCRAIVQSAGNYRSANLAVEGVLRDGEKRDLAWIVHPDDPTANEMDAWYSGRDRFVVGVRAPGEREFTEARLGEVIDIVHRGTTVGRIYHRRDDPNNHDNHMEIFLHKGAPAGTWTVQLTGDYVVSGRFNAWIERDLARKGAQSRFDPKSTSKRYTLGTIATSPLPITVGAYDAGADDKRAAHFSSLGPTRDGRGDKPELLAPGVKVMAARSMPRNAARQEGLLVARSGTSMAAPHVTGVVAAMFEAAGRLVSIDEIRDCLKRSAVSAGNDSIDSAWGRLDAASAIRNIRATRIPVHEGVTMNSDAKEVLLAGAELASLEARGDRRESESGFLSGLLRSLESEVAGSGLTPAALYRAAVRNGPLMSYTRDVLDVLGLPSQSPAAAPRAGDWMLRVAPGTGDVGHVAVLTSDALLDESSLDEVSAESSQPGFYGTVIEAGAFPHGRDRRFARRLLDRRGRVSPHTVILRPRYPQLFTALDSPLDDPELQGAGEDFTQPKLDICKKEWLTFLEKNFHEDVRKALVNGGSEAAVVIAIHHGQRDLRTLRQLSFYGKFGEARGYCPVGKNEHTYIGSWNDELQVVKRYLARPTLPRAQTGGVICQKVERRVEEVIYDVRKVDITGRYEYVSTDPSIPEKRGYTLNINQAGKHIEGHFAMVLYRTDDEKRKRAHTAIQGDLQADGSFLVYSREKPDEFWGYLTYEQKGPAGRLYWKRLTKNDIDPVTTRDALEKISGEPTLMEWVDEDHAFPGWDLVYRHEHFPLTRAQLWHLEAAFSAAAMAPLLLYYFTTPAKDRVAERSALSKAAVPLNEHVKNVFEHKVKGIHLADINLGRHYARNILSQNKWTFKKITRSILDWLQIAQDVLGRQENGMGSVTEYLGLRSRIAKGGKAVDPETPPNKFKVSVSLEPHRAIFYRGTITVERTTGRKWTETYSIRLKGLQVKPGSIKWSGESESYYDWNERDIPGDAELVFGDIGLTVPGVAGTLGAGFMHIFGSDYLPYLDVLGTESNAKLKLKKKFKFGINLGGVFGEISSKPFKEEDFSTFVPKTDYAAEFSLKEDIHFCFASALLTEDARQALRIVCANELVEFGLPDSELKVVGHTDSVGTLGRNRELSEMRAENTVRTIKGVLGNRFRIREENIKREGRGKIEAMEDNRRKSQKREAPDPKFRRVDITLNGRLVISLKEGLRP